MAGYVVIPTNFSRTELVWGVIEEAKKVANVVLVHTEEGTAEVEGTTTVRAHDKFSFPYWINRGLDVCDGPTIILNDDIIMPSTSMERMLDALDGYDLLTLPKLGGVTPISGWAHGLNPDRLRYDEEYNWWYSDDDLWERAKAGHYKITVADAPHVHDRERRPSYPPHLRPKVIADRARFSALWRGGSTKGLPS